MALTTESKKGGIFVRFTGLDYHKDEDRRALGLFLNENIKDLDVHFELICGEYNRCDVRFSGLLATEVTRRLRRQRKIQVKNQSVNVFLICHLLLHNLPSNADKERVEEMFHQALPRGDADRRIFCLSREKTSDGCAVARVEFHNNDDAVQLLKQRPLLKCYYENFPVTFQLEHDTEYYCNKILITNLSEETTKAQLRSCLTDLALSVSNIKEVDISYNKAIVSFERDCVSEKVVANFNSMSLRAFNNCQPNFHRILVNLAVEMTEFPCKVDEKMIVDYFLNLEVQPLIDKIEISKFKFGAKVTFATLADLQLVTECQKLPEFENAIPRVRYTSNCNFETKQYNAEIVAEYVLTLQSPEISANVVSFLFNVDCRPLFTKYSTNFDFFWDTNSERLTIFNTKLNLTMSLEEWQRQAKSDFLSLYTLFSEKELSELNSAAWEDLVSFAETKTKDQPENLTLKKNHVKQLLIFVGREKSVQEVWSITKKWQADRANTDKNVTEVFDYISESHLALLEPELSSDMSTSLSLQTLRQSHKLEITGLFPEVNRVLECLNKALNRIVASTICVKPLKKNFFSSQQGKEQLNQVFQKAELSAVISDCNESSNRVTIITNVHDRSEAVRLVESDFETKSLSALDKEQVSYLKKHDNVREICKSHSVAVDGFDKLDEQNKISLTGLTNKVDSAKKECQDHLLNHVLYEVSYPLVSALAAEVLTKHKFLDEIKNNLKRQNALITIESDDELSFKIKASSTYNDFNLLKQQLSELMSSCCVLESTVKLHGFEEYSRTKDFDEAKKEIENKWKIAISTSFSEPVVLSEKNDEVLPQENTCPRSKNLIKEPEVKIEVGAIEKEYVEGIVIFLGLKDVSEAVARSAGSAFQHKVKRLGYPKVSQVQDIDCSDSDLAARYVFRLRQPVSLDDYVSNIKNCLQKADELKISSIAFPALKSSSSSKVFADELFLGIRQYVSEAVHFSTSIRNIVIVLSNETYVPLFKEALDAFSCSKKTTLENGCCLTIKRCSILKCKTDVLVANQGIVLDSVVKADPTLSKKLKEGIKTLSADKALIDLGSSTIGCKNVYAVYPPSYEFFKNVKENSRNISYLVLKCLSEANKNERHSISIPAIGTGKLCYPATLCAKAILNAAEEFGSNVFSPHLKKILICVFDRQQISDFVLAYKSRFSELENHSNLSFQQIAWENKEFSFTRCSEVTVSVAGLSEESCKKGLNSFEEKMKSSCIEIQYEKSLPSTIAKKQLEEIAKKMKVSLVLKLVENKRCLFARGEKSRVNNAIKALHDHFVYEIECEKIMSKVVWTWNSQTSFKIFNKNDNKLLEDAFKKHPNERVKLKLTAGDCEVNFQKKTLFKLLSSEQHGEVARIVRTPGLEDIQLPDRWLCKSRGHVECALLSEKGDEYKRVLKTFAETFTEPFCIVKIERVESPNLYVLFTIAKNLLEINRSHEITSGRAVLQKDLFHGTTSDSEVITQIITHGYNRSYAGTSVGKKFGAGVYFAEESSIAHYYAKPQKNSGHRTMLYCHVLMGLYCKGNSSMRQPPVINPYARKPDNFDSTVDNTENPRIFVSCYRDNMVYPTYIITYVVPKKPFLKNFL